MTTSSTRAPPLAALSAASLIHAAACARQPACSGTHNHSLSYLQCRLLLPDLQTRSGLSSSPLPLRRFPKSASSSSESSKKNKGKEAEEGPTRCKCKRDEVASASERPTHGAAAEQPLAVGAKWKVPDNAAGAVEEEAFDEESKLLRTVFVGNLSLRTKRRSVPVSDMSAVAYLPHSLIRGGMASTLFLCASCRPRFQGKEPS